MMGGPSQTIQAEKGDVLVFRRVTNRTSNKLGNIALFATLLLGFHTASHACDKREPTREMSPGPHDYSAGVSDTRLWREGDDGEPLFLRARVLDTCGKPLVAARIQVLHANQDGDHEPQRWRAELTSDQRGTFKLVTVFPGYAGGIARHIHFIITHPDHQRLVTRLFFKNDPARDYDVDDLAMVLEEIEHNQGRGWVAGYEFVLPPR
jgi:protocatechuate 3,4-dioxygenase beta subunit